MTDETKDLAPAPRAAATIGYATTGGFVPTTFDEAYRMAQLFAQSDLVPRDYKGKPANCLVAMQMGAEIGLKPLQALQGIAVINGRPGIWGDALWALVMASPLVQDASEAFDDATMTATCTIKRRNRTQPTVVKFSKADAEKAGLWGKDGPWKTAPKRMLQMRARAFAARDAVPEVLKGVASADEMIGVDVIEADVPVIRAEPKQVEDRSAVAALKSRVIKKPEPEAQLVEPAVDPFVAELEQAKMSEAERADFEARR